MNDPNDETMSSNQRRIYLFFCTLPNCNDICLSRDKLLDHLAGHKLFETKVIDLDEYDNRREQLAEFVKMIDNGDNNVVISNTVNEPRMKTRNNSKKRCIFNNCNKTFADRKEAIDHLRKRHLTILDTLKNNLLQVSTKNDVVGGDIEDQPKSDSEHSNISFGADDYLEFESFSDTDNSEHGIGIDNEGDDQTWAPPKDSDEEMPEYKMVKPLKPSLKKKKIKPYKYLDNEEQLFVWLSDDANKKLPFKCLKCDKCYTNRYKVLNHIATVHDQKRFNCQFEGCSVSYTELRGLRLHESIVHTKDAVLIQCPWPDCEYASYHQKMVVRHRRIHTGERPYRCKWPDCQKAFKGHSALALHTASHRNERQHRCSWPGCSYSCNIAQSLRKHVELHEQGRLKEGVGGRQKISANQNSMSSTSSSLGTISATEVGHPFSELGFVQSQSLQVLEAREDGLAFVPNLAFNDCVAASHIDSF